MPPEREDRVLDQTRIRLKRIVAEAERDGDRRCFFGISGVPVLYIAYITYWVIGYIYSTITIFWEYNIYIYNNV